MSERSPRLFGLPTDVAVFIGLIAAPAIGGSLGTVLTFLIGALASGQVIDMSTAFSLGLSVGFLGGLVFGLPASFIIGTAVHTLMFWKGLVRVWHYAFFGALIGAINAPIFGLVSGALADVGGQALWLGACGAIGGVVFWWIRRPDLSVRSATAPPTP